MEYALIDQLLPEIRESVSAYLKKQSHKEKKEITDFQLNARSQLAINHVRPYIEKYIDLIKKKPSLSQKEKQSFLDQIFKEMTQDNLPEATPEYLFTFESFLKALKLVQHPLPK